MEITPAVIEGCLQRKQEAQKQLYQQLWPYLNAVCKRYLIRPEDSQDILQETFLLLFKNLHQFDAKKASLKTWSTRIAINCCLKQNDRHKVSIVQEQIIPLQEPKVPPEIVQQLSNEDLLKLVKRLPRPLYQVFNLHVIDGFSHQEISRILRISEDLSRQRLSRGRAWLRKKFPEDLQSSLHLNYH